MHVDVNQYCYITNINAYFLFELYTVEVMIEILFAVTFVLLLYIVAVGVSHVPFIGSLFFAPLLICAAMMLIMGHGEHKHKAHHKA